MTAEEMAAVLGTIATFDIEAVTVRIKRGEYVPVGHARYLRELARKALGLPLNDPPKAPAVKGVS